MDLPDYGLTHIVMPARAGREPRHPAIVLFHGHGGDELDIFGLGDHFDPRLYVVSGRGPIAMEPGYSWYERQDQGSFDRALGLATKLIQSLPELYQIDPARIYTLGFSQGTSMASALLLTHPELIAGSVLLSGRLPARLDDAADDELLANRPVFVGHGLEDPVVSVETSRQSRDFFTRVNADLTYQEYAHTQHQVSMSMLSDIVDWVAKQVG